MQEIDEKIHQSTRFRVLIELVKAGPECALDFMELMRIVGLTGGNLGGHLVKLEHAGYITQDKAFVRKRPRTLVRLTNAGLTAVRNHVALLGSLLQEAESALSLLPESIPERDEARNAGGEKSFRVERGSQVGFGGSGESFID